MVHSITFYQLDNAVKPANLFDKDNAKIINAYPNLNTGEMTGSSLEYSVIIPVKGNTTYTVQIRTLAATRRRIAEYSSYPQIGSVGTVLASTYFSRTEKLEFMRFHTSSTASFIVWFYAHDPSNEHHRIMMNSMMMEVGSNPSEYVPFGMQFDGNPKNTWEDWHIVSSSRPVFVPPKLKTSKLDIPGGNGNIDLSESLTGYPLFENSSGSLDFIVLNDYLPWQETYATISNYLHGKKLRAVLEDDPLYYREGRFTVNAWKSDKNFSRITIDYDLFPYKIRREESTIELNGITTFQRTYYLKPDFYGQMPTIPTFIVETLPQEYATIWFVNRTLHISATKKVTSGTYQFPELIFYGDHTEVYLEADNSTIYLEDSSGASILDNNGNQMKAEANAHVILTCQNGGLG